MQLGNALRDKWPLVLADVQEAIPELCQDLLNSSDWIWKKVRLLLFQVVNKMTILHCSASHCFQAIACDG